MQILDLNIHSDGGVLQFLYCLDYFFSFAHSLLFGKSVFMSVSDQSGCNFRLASWKWNGPLRYMCKHWTQMNDPQATGKLESFNFEWMIHASFVLGLLYQHVYCTSWNHSLCEFALVYIFVACNCSTRVEWYKTTWPCMEEESAWAVIGSFWTGKSEETLGVLHEMIESQELF